MHAIAVSDAGESSSRTRSSASSGRSSSGNPTAASASAGGGETNAGLGLDDILAPRSRSLVPTAVAWRSSSVASSRARRVSLQQALVAGAMSSSMKAGSLDISSSGSISLSLSLSLDRKS
jgi:hypothetical protein